MALLGGHYELGEPLGSGGMARVVAAYDRVLERQVAIKLINDTQLGDPAGRERFAREARAAAALQHPNTVGVFDVGDDDGRPFIVMELVDGRSLAVGLVPRAGSPQPRPCGSATRYWPGWPPRTNAGWSIATSSRRTSCSHATGR